MITSKLIERTQRRLDDITGRAFSGNEIVDELNLASAEICSIRTFKRYLFPQRDVSITLVSGTDSYTLPVDYNYQVHRVRLNPGTSTEKKLTFVPFDELQVFQEDLGTIEYYSVRGNKIYFAAVPQDADSGAVVEVLYAEKDGPYANDGNETILGAKYPHLLVNKVAFELSMSEQDGEIAAAADRLERAYLRGLDQAIQELSDQGTSESKYVRNNDVNLPI